MGTSGSGPAARGAPPAGEGQPRHISAVPVRAPQIPNGPNLPAGSAETALFRSAGRSAIGVSGVHGKSPSSQVVAAYSPALSSGAVSSDVSALNSKRRTSGRGSPLRAARTAAGSSAARPGLRSALTTVKIRSSPVILSVFKLPSGCSTFAWIGFASSRFASVTTSPAKFGVAALQLPSAQNAASVAGIARSTSEPYGSGRLVGRTESSSSRSTSAGCASA